MNRSLEQARLLQRKAASDRRILELGPPHVSGDIFGFHAQQAAEKLLKALLSARSATFRHTHDLAKLLEDVAAAGQPLGAEFDALKALTVYAVAFRYAELPPDLDLDRAALSKLIESLDKVVQNEIAGRSS